ncbi:MAG: TrbI/VirB10 family protein, partial [Candidatus Angelobacter sp.]
IRIVLIKRVRIAHAGAAVSGKVTDTVYAFDQPVIPAGSEARGHVARVAPISKIRRTMAFADADFSPPHQYTVTFDKIILGDGRELPVVTTATRGTQNVIHLTSDPARAAKRRNAATKALDSAKQQVKDTYNRALIEIKSPDKMRRAKQYLLAQLPYRRQYLESGTRFDADLKKPLDFGPAARVPGQLGSIGMEPAPDTMLHARLTGEVSSATASHGTPIEAVLTQPVFNSNHQLLLPANSRIIGEVTHAKPAGKLHHNGELRVVFERIETPEGQKQAMHGSLEGVEVDSATNMKLDSEGGAHTTDSKSRYLSTGLSLVAAAAASHPESDGGASDGVADPGARTLSGGSGFKLVGAVISLASNSKVFSSALGFYGAGMSVYSHFLSRGKDVVFPKDTPVEITFERGHTGGNPAQ